LSPELFGGAGPGVAEATSLAASREPSGNKACSSRENRPVPQPRARPANRLLGSISRILRTGAATHTAELGRCGARVRIRTDDLPIKIGWQGEQLSAGSARPDQAAWPGELPPAQDP